MIAKTLDSETVNAAYGALILKNIQDKAEADARSADPDTVRISFYTRAQESATVARKRRFRGRLGK